MWLVSFLGEMGWGDCQMLDQSPRNLVGAYLCLNGGGRAPMEKAASLLRTNTVFQPPGLSSSTWSLALVASDSGCCFLILD